MNNTKDEKLRKKVVFTNHIVFQDLLLNKVICKLFLEAVLGRKIKGIIYKDKEKYISGGGEYKDSYLDLYVILDDGTVIDIELQTRNNKGELPLRFRYYQSQIDSTILEKGQSYLDLRESYIIFLCTFDFFNKGFALYKRKIVFEGAEDIEYDDKSHLYLYNTKYKYEGECNKEMIDLIDYVNDNTYKPKYLLAKSINEGIEEFKANRRKMKMLQKGQDVLDERYRDGIDIGRNEGILSTARAMLKDNLPPERISLYTGLSIFDIEKLKK